MWVAHVLACVWNEVFRCLNLCWMKCKKSNWSNPNNPSSVWLHVNELADTTRKNMCKSHCSNWFWKQHCWYIDFAHVYMNVNMGKHKTLVLYLIIHLHLSSDWDKILIWTPGRNKTCPAHLPRIWISRPGMHVFLGLRPCFGNLLLDFTVVVGSVYRYAVLWYNPIQFI